MDDRLAALLSRFSQVAKKNTASLFRLQNLMQQMAEKPSRLKVSRASLQPPYMLTEK